MGRLVSAAAVEAAAMRGDRRLVVEHGGVISPLAHDRARELGIELVTAPASDVGGGADAGAAAPGAPEVFVRDALRRALGRLGETDLDEVVRATLAEVAPQVTAAPVAAAGQVAGGDLDGRVALVTGAASGIGAATAVELARVGAHVVVGTFRGDPHDPERTLAAIAAVGGSAAIADIDVRSSEQVGQAVADAVDRWGRFDIAVANAAVLSRDPIDQLDDGTWEQVIDVDLGGVVRLCRAAASAFDGPGAIVAVGSIAGGVFGWSEHSHYAAAKAGILGLVRSLAAELGPRGVRVNAVLPGMIETPQSLDERASVGAAGLEAAASSVPLQRIGTSEEIARAIRFLVSDDASYLTGHGLVVDGGVSTSLTL